MSRRAALLAAALSCASCSFTTATGFKECDTDNQCATDSACVQTFCIKLFPGCLRQTGAFDTANRVVFAATLPITDVPDAGTVDQSEVSGLDALALAVEEGNERDGIKGKKFALLICNTGSDNEVAKAQVQWLWAQLKVPAVITSGSGQTIAVANVAAPLGVLTMSATSTSPELISTYQNSNQLVWRTAPPDSLQARVLADYLKVFFPDPMTAKIGILYVQSTYGEGLSSALRARLDPRFTPKEIPYPRGGDVTQAVNDLSTFAPTLTVLVGFAPDVRAIINLARTKANLSRASGHQWLFTDSAKDPEILLDATLPELGGSFGIAPAQGAGATFPSFKDRFSARYSFDPSNYSFTSHSYDAMYVLMLGAAWATGNSGALTGPRMAEGILHMSSGTQFELVPANFSQSVSAMQAGTSIDVEGASGHLDFDPDAGAPPSPYELWKVETDGGFSTIPPLLVPSGS